jgi:hypothetical protein
MLERDERDDARDPDRRRPPLDLAEIAEQRGRPFEERAVALVDPEPPWAPGRRRS